jgi:hypothetical protein
MIYVAKHHRIKSLPDHTQHFSSCRYEIAHRGRIVKSQPDPLGGFALFFQDEFNDLGYQFELRSVEHHAALRLVQLFLTGPEARVNECYWEMINQAERQVDVIKVNRTRARIAYELPNSGESVRDGMTTFERS